MNLKDYQSEFIAFAIQYDVLSFGDFTLKSGRKSPYFFNMGKLNTGFALKKLGEFYAASIIESTIDFDLLFGPAYKGIPIVSSTAIALSEKHHIDKPYAFNRKEVKDHGEGGWFVGAPISGNILLLDDVITAGTAIKQVIELLHTQKSATLKTCFVALDRQEKGANNLTAIEDLAKNHGVYVQSIVTLTDLLTFLEKAGNQYQKERDIMIHHFSKN